MLKDFFIVQYPDDGGQMLVIERKIFEEGKAACEFAHYRRCKWNFFDQKQRNFYTQIEWLQVEVD